MAADALFQPWSFKGLNLKNRIVMAPMTRSKSPGGVATEEVAQYYKRRAAAEVGLIVSEGTGVSRPASLNDANVPRFHGETELKAWKRVIDEVHSVGGAMAPSSGTPALSAPATRAGTRKAAMTAPRVSPAPASSSASR